MEYITLASAIIGGVGAISIVVLFIQTAFEDARIVFVGLVGPLASFLLTKPGTKGALLMGTVFSLAVVVLMAPVIFRNIRQTWIWGPLLGIVSAAISAGILYGSYFWSVA